MEIRYFPGVGGWPGREIKSKANLSTTELPAELELGLSLAKTSWG